MSVKMPITATLPYQPAIAIRRAEERDRSAVERLAALDSTRVPRGPVLIGEVDGEPWAAVGLEDGHTVADPFHRTAGIVDLLRARARHAGAPAAGRARPLLAPRWAA